MRRLVLTALALLGTVAGWAGPAVELAPSPPGPGEVFEVRVRGLDGSGPYEASLDGRRFPLWPAKDGWEGLAALDRDAEPGPRELRVLGEAGQEALVALAVGRRHYPEQRLTVSERMVSLSAEDQARASREAALIRETVAGRSVSRLWTGPFRMPVEGPVSGPFGVRRVYNGQPRSYHGGLDLAAPRGAPVLAAAGGTAVLVGDFFYTGNTVFLDHGLGLFTAYFHLESTAVGQGEAVAAGALLGRVGSTGRSTGAHLHWGAYLAGLKADPLSLLRATGGGKALDGGQGGTNNATFSTQ